MFQYAFAASLSKYCTNVKLDISRYDYYKIHNNYELEKIFNVHGNYATLKEIRKLGYSRDNKLTNIIIKSPFVKKSVFNEGDNVYDIQDLPCDGIYFRGFWQNEKYFSDIRSNVLKFFTFPEIYDNTNSRICEEIRAGVSVSMHVRRGDYLNHPLYMGLCDITYYQSAYDYLVANIGGNFNLFVFSNDINWVKENMHFPNMYIVDNNQGESSFRDMQLMALCNHNIVANSSFSWWGAWLNQYDNKIVIAPKKWINRETPLANAVIPDIWVKL